MKRNAHNLHINYPETIGELQNVWLQLCNMNSMLHFLHNHHPRYPEILGEVSGEQGEPFHQELKVMEERYQGRRDVCKLNSPGITIQVIFYLELFHNLNFNDCILCIIEYICTNITAKQCFLISHQMLTFKPLIKWALINYIQYFMFLYTKWKYPIACKPDVIQKNHNHFWIQRLNINQKEVSDLRQWKLCSHYS